MVMERTKILSMCVENLHFIDSLIFVSVFLKSVHHKCNKGFHVHFCTAKNLDCVGSYLEPKEYGTDFTSGEDRNPIFGLGLGAKGHKFP
jgi:hypothetical protein